MGTLKSYWRNGSKYYRTVRLVMDDVGSHNSCLIWVKVVHRVVVYWNLKPDNILINPLIMSIKLIDFGDACDFDSNGYIDFPGTKPYCAIDVIPIWVARKPKCY